MQWKDSEAVDVEERKEVCNNHDRFYLNKPVAYAGNYTAS